MAFAVGKVNISFTEILDLVSEEAILNYYTGIQRVPCVINSILRVDKHPSMGVYYSTNGIAYTDFATKDNGSLTDLLCKFLNLRYIDLKARILQDIDNIRKLDNRIINNESIYKYNKEYRSQINQNKKEIHTHKEINVKVRGFEQHDINYWESYGINLRWLQFGKVYPISHIFLGDKCYGAEKYAYAYIEYKDNNVSKKIYQPYSKKLKWISNHNASVWDLWMQMMNSNSKKCIITKSRKDALCIWANTDISSTSLQAEGFLPKEHVLNIVKNKFNNNVYLLYDNDFDKEKNYGRTYGNKISELYDIKQIEIPEELKSKDPSDLYKNKGKDILIKTIKELTD